MWKERKREIEEGERGTWYREEKKEKRTSRKGGMNEEDLRKKDEKEGRKGREEI